MCLEIFACPSLQILSGKHSDILPEATAAAIAPTIDHIYSKLSPELLLELEAETEEED